MADITLSDTPQITDPAIRAIAQRVANTVNVAAGKAVASTVEPAKFPLPKEQGSLEHLMRGRFQRLPQAAQAKAKANVMALVKSPMAQRQKQFGDLAGLDLSSTVPVEAQAAAAPLPKAMMLPAGTLTARAGTAAGAAAAAPAAAAAANKELALRIHRVTCRDETSELGKDEIHLGGTSVDETADTKTVSSFKVASFNTGDVKTFSPPRRFTFFNVTEGGAKFPKSYSVVVILVEKDMGDLAEFLDKLADKVRDQLKKELLKAGANKGPIGVIVALALGFVLDKVFDFLKGLWGDEIFAPRTVSISLPSATHRFPGGKLDSPERTLTYSGHGGRYEVVYDWQLST